MSVEIQERKVPMPRKIPLGYVVQERAIGYRVISPKLDVYHVGLSATLQSCTCPDFTRYGHLRPCKHIELVKAYEARIEEALKERR